jgi:catechol 2,3-dioxygenase
MSINPATTMGPVTLKVVNLAELTGFYRDVVGLRVKAEQAGQVTLGTKSRTLVILRQVDAHPPAPYAPGLYHLALRVPSRAALGHWLRHYVELNGPYWQGASDHGVSDALYLADPEGNGIEITCDSPRDTWRYHPDGELVMGVDPLDLDALLTEAPQSPWQGIDPATDMGHVHLKVSDIDQARAFYVDLFGFELQAAFQDSALFVSAGGYHHHVGLNTWHSRGRPPAAAAAPGLAEFMIRLPDAAEQQRLVTRLGQAGYALDEAGQDALVRDPAGNRIRLHTG